MLFALLSGSLIAAGSETVGAFILLGSAVFFGLPHGACDLWLLNRRAHGVTGSSKNLALAGILTVYVFATLIVLAAWLALPGPSLAAFLLLTALHFGSGDEAWEHRKTAPVVESFLRGLVIISAPLAFHPQESRVVLNSLVGQPDSSSTVERILYASDWGLPSGVALLLTIDVWSGLKNRGFPWTKWVELPFLILFFALMTPLYAVASYFVLMHSWRHMFRLETYDSGGVEDFDLPKVMAAFYKRALPLTILTIAALVGVYLLFKPEVPLLLQWSSAYLILLSALTVPHSFLIAATEKQLVNTVDS